MGPERRMQWDGNAVFLHPCLSHPSLAWAGHRQSMARHDSTSLLCHCCCPALPRLLTASMIPACSLPASAHPSKAAASMSCAPGGSGCQDFFPGHPTVRGETEVQAALVFGDTSTS